jgi:ABC-type phosphate transport system permease subunit
MFLLVFVISKHDMSEKPTNVAGILQPILTTFVDVIIAATIAGPYRT